MALKVAIAILVLLAVAGTLKAVIGGGGSDPNYRVVTVGKVEVSIPFFTSREELIPVTINKYLAKLGYVTSYRRCVSREIAKAVGPTELEEDAKLPDKAFKKKGLDLIAQASPICAEAKRAILSPNATPRQIAIIRESFVEALPLELGGLNLTDQQVACAENRVGEISDSDVLAIENDGPQEGEAILVAAMKPCFS